MEAGITDYAWSLAEFVGYHTSQNTPRERTAIWARTEICRKINGLPKARFMKLPPQATASSFAR